MKNFVFNMSQLNNFLLFTFCLLAFFSNTKLPGSFLHIPLFAIFLLIFSTLISKIRISYKPMLFIFMLVFPLFLYFLTNFSIQAELFFGPLYFWSSAILIYLMLTNFYVSNTELLKITNNVILIFIIIGYLVLFNVLPADSILNEVRAISEGKRLVFLESEPARSSAVISSVLVLNEAINFRKSNIYNSIIFPVLLLILMMAVQSKYGYVFITVYVFGKFFLTVNFRYLNNYFVFIILMSLFAAVAIQFETFNYLRYALSGFSDIGSYVSRLTYLYSGLQSITHYPLGLGPLLNHFNALFIESSIQSIGLLNQELFTSELRGNIAGPFWLNFVGVFGIPISTFFLIWHFLKINDQINNLLTTIFFFLLITLSVLGITGSITCIVFLVLSFRILAFKVTESGQRSFKEI